MCSSLVQVSVIFLANVRSAMPENWQAQWHEQEAWLKRKAGHEEAVVKKEEEVCHSTMLFAQRLHHLRAM